jgi:FeS assembly SUF system protein
MNPKNVELGMSRMNPHDSDTRQELTSPEDADAKETPSEPLRDDQIDEMRKKVIDVLCTCFDPEIPVNIYELGLIYDIVVHNSRKVDIRMTLTSPACPVAGSLPGDVQRKIEAMPEIASAQVDLVWDPPWDQNRMSEAAKLQLGFD